MYDFFLKMLLNVLLFFMYDQKSNNPLNIKQKGLSEKHFCEDQWAI